MEEKICGTCKYFAQHYRKWGRGYHEVDCGHCKYPRIKKRTKDHSILLLACIVGGILIARKR